MEPLRAPQSAVERRMLGEVRGLIWKEEVTALLE